MTCGSLRSDGREEEVLGHLDRHYIETERGLKRQEGTDPEGQNIEVEQCTTSSLFSISLEAEMKEPTEDFA